MLCVHDVPPHYSYPLRFFLNLSFFIFHSFTFIPLSPPSPLLFSDYIIKEKTVLLQKKDNEGFGFVLRGAKGERLIKIIHHSLCCHSRLHVSC